LILTAHISSQLHEQLEVCRCSEGWWHARSEWALCANSSSW